MRRYCKQHPQLFYAGAASMNAEPGGRFRFFSSKKPLALMAKEQYVFERRMNVIVRKVEEIRGYAVNLGLCS
jgi:hypothetical protein